MRKIVYVLMLVFATLALADIEVTMFYYGNEPGGRRTTAMAIDSLDNIWCGQWLSAYPPDSLGGVYRFDGSDWDHYTIANTGGDLLCNNIRDVEVAPDGKVWIATGFGATYDSMRATLYYFDHDDERWHRVGPELGNPRWWYRDIEFDSEGNLWASDNMGYMVKYDGTTWACYHLVDMMGFIGARAMMNFAIDEYDHLWGSFSALDTLYEFREIIYNKYPIDTSGVGLIPPPPPPPIGNAD